MPVFWLRAAGTALFAAVIVLSAERQRFLKTVSLSADGTGPTGISKSWLAALDRDTSDTRSSEVHRFEADPGEFVLSGFRPGLDVAEVDLTGAHGEVHFETVDSKHGAALSFSVVESHVLTMRFDGLFEVPATDVIVILRDISTGRVSQLLADLTRIEQDSRQSQIGGSTHSSG